MRVAAVKLAMAGLALATLGGAATAEQPPTRQPIEMPADVEAIFRAQMLGHIVSLDAMMQALAKGDYERAAQVAEQEIVPAREQGADASGRTAAEGAPSEGVGIAAHVPARFLEIAAEFHDAGERFAMRARSMPASPSDVEHRALLAAFADVTAQCRTCHDSFIVP